LHLLEGKRTVSKEKPYIPRREGTKPGEDELTLKGNFDVGVEL
jgi:hypothetical protein